MSPEERQMLTDLFERVRSQANTPRDRDAEALIAQSVQAQPYAPYLLSQAVIVQEHALKAAEQKILELQNQVSQLQTQAAPQPSGGGSFLGGLFGGGAAAPRPAPQPQQQPNTPPNPWGAAQAQPQYAAPPAQAAPSPWGAPAASQGGGFLKGALGAAAGVAGGVLLADSIRGLMGGGGHSSGLFGGGLGGSGLGGSGLGGSGLGGGETIVNNYYDSPGDNDSQDADYQSADDDDVGGDDDYSDDV